MDLYASDDPIELLWSLLLLQCSQRQTRIEDGLVADGNAIPEELYSMASLIESLEPMVPNLISTLRETELAVVENSVGQDLGRCGAQASALLQAYGDPSCFHTILTPQWTFKAAQILSKYCTSSPNDQASKDFQLGLLMLDRDTAQWPSCRYLLDALLDS